MISDELKRLRKQHHLTQQQLAEAFNVSQSTIASWENGTRQPVLDFIPTIAEYYGISADQLFGTMDGGTPNKNEPYIIKTDEVKILASGMDKMPKEKRETLVNMAKLMFGEYFEGGTETHDNNTEL